MGPTSIYNLGISNFVEEECFKITFNDNTHMIIPVGGSILSTNREFYKFKKCVLPYKGHRVNREVETKYFEFNQECLDPYLIGLLSCFRTKNGNFDSAKLRKYNLDDAPVSYYQVRIKNTTQSAKIVPKPDYPNILSADIKRLGLDCNLKYRFIPENYLLSDRISRIQVVQGIMDANGSIKKDALSFMTSSLSLSQDLAFLVRSLGGFARISKLHNKTSVYRVDLNVDFEPFLLAKQVNIPNKRVKKMVDIEKMGIQPCAEIPTNSLIIDNFLEVS